MPRKPPTFHPLRGLQHKPKEARPNAHQRGYDATWRKFRLLYLAKHPLCVECLKTGRAEQATDIDHIKELAEYPHLKYDLGNLRALCSRCHKARHAREGRSFGRRRTH